MAFSKDIKAKALVLCARHCCVCHRYKGVRLEIHHIVPQSENGLDELENAIALCFDCHADAGHYNVKHPRGTRFTPAELVKARDAWHENVRLNKIPNPENEDLLYCRYLVCKDFEALKEICAKDFKHFPVPAPLVIENECFGFLSSILNKYTQTYRRTDLAGEVFDDVKAYLIRHPESDGAKLAGSGFPAFDAVRIPSRHELEQFVIGQDVITQILFEAGVPSAELSRAVVTYQGCGAGGVQESYLCRELWAGFLAITNISESPICLDSLHAQVEEVDGFGYRPFLDVSGAQVKDLELPKILVLPQSTAIVPIAILLAPLSAYESRTGGTTGKEIESARIQEVSHVQITRTSLPDFRQVGSGIRPAWLNIAYKGEKKEQGLHVFDLSNMYTIDRHWQMGSCPHMFEVGQDDELKYIGELFRDEPDKLLTQLVRLRMGTMQLIIAELEHETTIISTILGPSGVIASDIVLGRGEEYCLNVQGMDHVVIMGKYVVGTSARPIVSESVMAKNSLVFDFMARCKSF